MLPVNKLSFYKIKLRKKMRLLTPIIPAILPLATMIWIRLVSDYNVNLFLRKDFENEYDFIVGKVEHLFGSSFSLNFNSISFKANF